MTPADDEQLKGEVLHNYHKYNMMYDGVPMKGRPRISKVSGYMKFYAACKIMNSLVEDSNSRSSSLEELFGVVHCAALAVCTTLLRSAEKQEYTTTLKRSISRNKPVCRSGKKESKTRSTRLGKR